VEKVVTDSEKFSGLWSVYALAPKNPASVKQIYINPDLTPLEQRKSRALRQQLADLNKESNAYIIKNSMIVRRR